MRPSSMLAMLSLLAACFLTAGCNQKQDPDELRRETAHATTVLKQDTQAVAEGVREGLKSDKPLDLNDAPKKDLLDLPGVSSDRADRIIAARPYGSTDDLVSRRILPQSEYDRIKDHIAVGKPSPSK